MENAIAIANTPIASSPDSIFPENISAAIKIVTIKFGIFP